MNRKNDRNPPRDGAEARAARLKAALKANMARRKQQARARALGSSGDDTQNGK